MTSDDKIKYEKLQYDLIREAAEHQKYHQAKLIKMNILQTKDYYLLIKLK